MLRDCVRSQRSIGGDLALLLREAEEAQGLQHNHACGRMAGFIHELDRVFSAIRDADVSLDLPEFDEFGLSRYNLKRE